MCWPLRIGSRMIGCAGIWALALLLLSQPRTPMALTVEGLRSVLMELVEEGVLSHRQANTVYSRANEDPITPPPIPSNKKLRPEALLTVLVDGVAKDIHETNGQSLDKTASDFCLAMGIHGHVYECAAIRNSLIDRAAPMLIENTLCDLCSSTITSCPNMTSQNRTFKIVS